VRSTRCPDSAAVVVRFEIEEESAVETTSSEAEESRRRTSGCHSSDEEELRAGPVFHGIDSPPLGGLATPASFAMEAGETAHAEAVTFRPARRQKPELEEAREEEEEEHHHHQQRQDKREATLRPTLKAAHAEAVTFRPGRRQKPELEEEREEEEEEQQHQRQRYNKREAGMVCSFGYVSSPSEPHFILSESLDVSAVDAAIEGGLEDAVEGLRLRSAVLAAVAQQQLDNDEGSVAITRLPSQPSPHSFVPRHDQSVQVRCFSAILRKAPPPWRSNEFHRCVPSGVGRVQAVFCGCCSYRGGEGATNSWRWELQR
jgi:hypothetical protein